MKKASPILLSLIFIFSFTFNVLGNNINVAQNKINIDKNNVILTGEYPVISGLSNKNFEKSVNTKIDNIIKTNVLASPQKVTNKIDMYYDIIKDNNITSIMLYFKNLYTNEISVYSLNINTKTNKYVDINSYLGVNGLNYVNKVVLNKANNMGISYKKITQDTPFYVKNQNVYIVFGAGSLTFSQKGNIIFEVPYKNLTNYQINKEKYYKKSQYNVKMVLLRDTLEYFGYTMNWQESTNSITVLKNGKFVSYLVIGENRYSDKNNKIIRQLEFAPEIKNGKAYVPISYFSQILDMLFATDNKENIVISSYKL